MEDRLLQQSMNRQMSSKEIVRYSNKPLVSRLILSIELNPRLLDLSTS